jgi:hypothetical protein
VIRRPWGLRHRLAFKTEFRSTFLISCRLCTRSGPMRKQSTPQTPFTRAPTPSGTRPRRRRNNERRRHRGRGRRDQKRLNRPTSLKRSMDARLKGAAPLPLSIHLEMLSAA